MWEIKNPQIQNCLFKNKNWQQKPMFVQLKGQPWEAQIDFVSFATNQGNGRGGGG